MKALGKLSYNKIVSCGHTSTYSAYLIRPIWKACFPGKWWIILWTWKP